MRRYRTPLRQILAAARRLGLGNNPLRRHTDRVESLVLLGAIVIALVGLGLGVAVGEHTADSQARQAAHEQATRHPAVAVLLEPAVTNGRQPAAIRVRARWKTPNGSRVGTITVTADHPTGDRIPIWIDRAGKPVNEPITDASAVVNAISVGLGVGVTGLLVAWSVVRLVRLRLDHGRYAEWERGWARVEPAWTRRRTQ